MKIGSFPLEPGYLYVEGKLVEINLRVDIEEELTDPAELRETLSLRDFAQVEDYMSRFTSGEMINAAVTVIASLGDSHMGALEASSTAKGCHLKMLDFTGEGESQGSDFSAQVIERVEYCDLISLAIEELAERLSLFLEKIGLAGIEISLNN